METLARKSEGQLTCKECGKKYLTTRNRKTSVYCSSQCCAKAKSLPLLTPIAVVREMYLEQRLTTREIATRLGSTWKHVSKALKSDGVDLISNRRAKKRSCSRTYRKAVEMEIGRSLATSEIVHHLDCNPTNNKEENLVVVSRRRHGELHKQLETISAQLYKKGLITYSPHHGYQITQEFQ